MKNHLLYLQGKKVYLGLSGGVDSAVSAALLQEAGVDVTGVFIQGWYPEGMPCTWSADRRDAMRVAAHLQIPFLTLDASKEYKKGVIDYLLSEYRAGRTPNPDSMCNKDVKFGAFYRFAMAHGADFIATGHYAQLMTDSRGVHLLRGNDESKDQSYFLWAVPREVLSKTIFPIGTLPKTQVRVLAQKYNLPNAQKKDSQGICFLGDISVEDFLKKEIGATVGLAFDESGSVIGTHNGVLLHTLGERIAIEGASSGPWYVLKKDVEKNILIVGHSPYRADVSTTSISLLQTNIFSSEQVTSTGKVLQAQYRYHGPRISGTYSRDENIFIPQEPLREVVASGQSLVLYDNEECLGGGIII